MSKSCVAFNLAYVSHKGKHGKSGNSQLRAKLRYFQYRNDRDGTIPQEQGLERWVDRGLGTSWGEVQRNCSRLASRDVLAWTLVISPDPQLMELVPETSRLPLLKSITEQTVEAYYNARGADVAEYSYVTHERLTNKEQPDDEGVPQLHSHVILPGSVPVLEGGREAFYNRASEGHFEQFRSIANSIFGTELDRMIGKDWRLEREQNTPQKPLMGQRDLGWDIE
jgi:hypothetical protein